MDYITVKEFAECAGISKQAVYKKIKTPDFQKYVQKIGNITLISELALVEIGKLDIEYSVENNQHEVEDIKHMVENDKIIVENLVKKNKPKVEKSKQSVEYSKSEVENGCITCQLVETLQKENEYIKKQLENIIQLSNKQLNQIENLYSQLQDKDKLIEQLSTQMLNQTRLPVIVDPPKQTLWQKLKSKFFNK